MATGVSHVIYPRQPKPLCDLDLENCYYLIKLHDAQAFFEAGWLVKPGTLIFSSSVESSFQPGTPTQSLHLVTTLQKHVPCHLGVSTNLTDWLPARATDTLRVTLKYVVIQDTPFKELVDQVTQIGLAAKVSLVRPDWAVAVKVSEVVGRMLSYLLQEGQQREVFPLTVDLNLADLSTGYYAVIGSQRDEGWPTALQIDPNGRLADLNNHLLLRHSYAVLQILAVPRRGQEIARGEPWWELLQLGREHALDAYPINDQERRKALGSWRTTLAEVRALARKERGILLQEIGDIIRSVQVEVEEHLLGETTPEAFDTDALPREWQELLDVPTRHILYRSVQDYQNLLSLSQSLLEKYPAPML